MERLLIVGLAISSVAVGIGAAVLRPDVATVGHSQPPQFNNGTVVDGWSGGGGSGGGGINLDPLGRRRRDFSRFPGRGPGWAK